MPLLNLSVGLCVRVCIIRFFLLISRAAQGRFPQTPDLWHRASVDERVELVLSHALSEWSRAPRCYKCRGVFRVARIVPFLVNSIFFFFERPRPAASMRPPYLIYLSTSTRVRTGCHYLMFLSVCACVCVIFVVFRDCASYTRPSFTNLGLMEAGEYRLARGTCFCRMLFRARRGRRAAADFVVCFGWGGFFRFFFS